MKRIKLLALSAIVAGFATSCQKDDVSNDTLPQATVELSKDHQLGLKAAGVNPNGAEYVTMKHFDGAPYQAIKSGDIIIALDKLAGQALAEEGDTKQYRTRNLVNQNRTIRVVGYTGSGFALTSNMQTGLQWAVNNYNRVNTSLNFVLSFAASTDGDMIVYNAGGSGVGGQAEFPENGNPGKFIQIFGGMASESNNLNEHVIGHEMGHALGFRHTDFARRRCADGSNEGDGGVGAIHIPGTPTANRWGQSGLDVNSQMISCFDGSEDGEFSDFDIVALEYLY